MLLSLFKDELLFLVLLDYRVVSDSVDLLLGLGRRALAEVHGCVKLLDIKRAGHQNPAL